MSKTQLKNRAKWLTALKSGEYEQTINGVLKDPYTNSYCCLGVACVALGIPAREHDDHVFFRGETELAPEEVVKMLGLNNNGGALKTSKLDYLWADIDAGVVDYNSLSEDKQKHLEMYKRGTLTEANDSGEYSFKDIAEFIEAYPEAVFKDS